MNYQLIVPHWAISADTGAIDIRHVVIKNGDIVTPFTQLIAEWQMLKEPAVQKVPAGCTISLANNRAPDFKETEPEEEPPEDDPHVRRNQAQASTFSAMYGEREPTAAKGFGLPYGTSNIGIGDHVPRFKFEHCGETATYIREDHVGSLLQAKAERERSIYNVPAGANVCYGYFDETGFKHALWHDHTTLQADETVTRGYFVPFDHETETFTEEMLNRGLGVYRESTGRYGTDQDAVRNIYRAMEAVRPVRVVKDEWAHAVREAFEEMGRGDAFQIKEPAVAIGDLLAAKAHDVRTALEDVHSSDAPTRNPANYTDRWLISIGYIMEQEQLPDVPWTLASYRKDMSCIQIYEHRGIRLMHRNDNPGSYYVLEHPHPSVLTSHHFHGTSRAVLGMLARDLPDADAPAEAVKQSGDVTSILLQHAQLFDEAADAIQGQLDNEQTSDTVVAYRRGRRNAFRRAACIVRGEPADEQ